MQHNTIAIKTALVEIAVHSSSNGQFKWVKTCNFQFRMKSIKHKENSVSRLNGDNKAINKRVEQPLVTAETAKHNCGMQQGRRKRKRNRKCVHTWRTNTASQLHLDLTYLSIRKGALLLHRDQHHQCNSFFVGAYSFVHCSLAYIAFNAALHYTVMYNTA